MVTIGIIFIPDFTYDFFQQILQSDHSHAGAVFVQNKGNVHGGFPHFHHQISGLFILIGIISRAQDILYLKRPLTRHEQEVLDVDDAHYVVRVIFINGNTGIHGFSEYGKQLIVRGVDVNHRNINFRDHNVFGIGITEVEYIVDHFAFLCFNGTVLMADIHISF